MVQVEWMGVQPLKSDVARRGSAMTFENWIAVRMAFSPFSSNALVWRHRKGPTGAPRSARASILLNRPNLITYRAPVSMERPRRATVLRLSFAAGTAPAASATRAARARRRTVLRSPSRTATKKTTRLHTRDTRGWRGGGAVVWAHTTPCSSFTPQPTRSCLLASTRRR